MREIYTKIVNHENFVVWLRGYFKSYWDSRFMAYMQGQSTIGGIISSKPQNFLRVSLPTKPTALSVDKFLSADLPSDRKFTLSATYDNGSRFSITFDPVSDTETRILVCDVSLDEFFAQDLKDNLAFNFGTGESHQENVLPTLQGTQNHDLQPIELNLTPEQVVDLLVAAHGIFLQLSESIGCPKLYNREHAKIQPQPPMDERSEQFEFFEGYRPGEVGKNSTAVFMIEIVGQNGGSIVNPSLIDTQESIKSQLQSFWHLLENLGETSQPKGASTDEESETGALSDLIEHLEQGLDRNEAREKMSLTLNGLKSRQQRLRKLWDMPKNSTWSDYVAKAKEKRGARGA